MLGKSTLECDSRSGNQCVKWKCPLAEESGLPDDSVGNNSAHKDASRPSTPCVGSSGLPHEEPITPERTLPLDQNGAMSHIKPDVPTDRLRAGMVGTSLLTCVSVSIVTAPKDSLVWQRPAASSCDVPLFAHSVDPKLHPRTWADGRCVRDLDHKKVRTQADRPGNPETMPG